MTSNRGFVICFQQTCRAKNMFPHSVPECCGERKHQHCDFTIEANKGPGGKQTDDPLLPISAGMHLKWKWLTFKCNSWNHKTDETWEPKQIFHPKWARLSSGDVFGMIAWRRLACAGGSSWNPQRSVWTSETQEIADQTEKWLLCVVHDCDPGTDVFVRRVCVYAEFRCSCLRRSCPLEQCRRHQTSACSGGMPPKYESLHANEAPPCGRDRLPWSKKYHKQQRWKFQSKTKKYTQISSDAVQTPNDIITPQRGKLWCNIWL